MPIYPYSFQLPPLNVQDIPNDGAPGEFLGISAGGALDWLPAGGGGSGDMLAANNLSELTNFATARTNIGLGTASTPTFANLTLTSPSLSSSAPVTISQTWAGTGSTVFTALKVNATTTTGSALTAKLLDLQHSNLNRFSVQKDGYTIIGASDVGSAVRILDLINQYGNVGFQVGGGGRLDIMNGGSTIMSLFSNGAMTLSGTSAYMAIGGNVILARDADNTLALRNGAAAQTFNVYGTYSTSPSLAYSRLAISCDTSGNATLTTQSTGVAGTVSINGVPVGLGPGSDFESVAIGTLVLGARTSGFLNVGVGRGTFQRLTTGSANTGIGAYTLNYVTTGGYNHAFGYGALNRNVSGSYNGAIGYNTLYLAAGNSNNAFGSLALFSLTTGDFNNAIGESSGRFIADGSTANSVCNNSIFIGANSKALASSQTNQIVIGHDATGIGSNSVVLGNDLITKTALKGNVGIGTTSPTSKLQVTNGDVEIETVTSGIIMKAAGTANRYRITLNAGGTDFVITAL